jgi:aspartate/methionine/tyrosine aminotransferase
MIQTAKRIDNVEEYYFSKKLTEVRSLDTPELAVINLGIGSPDMAPSPETIRALIQSAEMESNHGYQSYKGIAPLRRAIAEEYARTYQVSLDPESEILPLMGSKEGIFHISMAFVNEGEEVLIPDPGYPTYASAAKLVGGKVRTYKMKESLNWSIDLQELSQQDLSKVKIMWVNFPHMPTGCVATSEELNDLVSLARTNNFLIVNDNPYSLILNDSPLSILKSEGAMDVAMELNSLSKSHNMAGWRIGWVAGNREHVDAVLKVKSNMDSGMFLSLQHAAIEALKCGAQWRDELNQIYRNRCRSAKQILDELGCTYADGQSGLFVWAKVSEEVVDVENWIDTILYGAKVFLTPGSIFGSQGNRFVRISLCAPEAKMEEALRRIKSWKQSIAKESQQSTKLSTV